MPTGKVKWYDAEKGFGFLSREDGDDVYVNASALPDGTTTLKNGARVEFGVAQGKRGDQALQVTLLESESVVANQRSAQRTAQRSARSAQRKKPEEMAGIVEDLIKLLEGVSEGYQHGRRPDNRTAKPTAKLLRALADELD